MDVSNRRKFESPPKNPKAPLTSEDLDQFMENRFIIMSPSWGGGSGSPKYLAS